MRSLRQIALGLGCLLALGIGAPQARADVSGWADVSSGALGWQTGVDDEFKFSPMLAFDAGVGSADSEPIIVGGLFRLQPVIEHGTDLAWLARIATQGFQSGWFGVALDVGPYGRFWGAGSAGLLGQGTVGGPLGLQLSVLGSFGTEEAAGFGVTLGLDFARLTVHRGSLTDWWPNPRAEDALDAERATAP